MNASLFGQYTSLETFIFHFQHYILYMCPPSLKVKASYKSFTHTSETSDTSSLAYKLLCTQNWKWSVKAFKGHASSPSFLSRYWYMGSWPPLQEGWGSTMWVCACMCACAVKAQWEVDDECFWLDNWFAPVFTFNLWWAWPVEGSQSGTAGFNLKRLNGLSKSHRKLCHSLTNAYWEFPVFFKATFIGSWLRKSKIIQLYTDFHSAKKLVTEPPEILINN